MEKKYNINYNNICVLFYRGNDKITETLLCNYNEYLIYANLLLHLCTFKTPIFLKVFYFISLI